MMATVDETAIAYVRAEQIDRIIAAHRVQIIDLVAATYRAFYAGNCTNPDTYSLTFPQKPGCRINALPAYVGGGVDKAGLKWVSSFPQNSRRGLQRAAAVIVLNSFETGYPIALMDGALISAARTAASAALGARLLRRDRHLGRLRMFGAGVINRTVATFLAADGWTFDEVAIVDPDVATAEALRAHIAKSGIGREIQVEKDVHGGDRADMLSFATSQLTPWYDADIVPQQVVLHVSLRDIVPDRLRGALNIVDDIDHALKANTSLHRLEGAIGRTFPLVNFGHLMDGTDLDRDAGGVVSAFGMGMLDVALANFVFEQAARDGAAEALPGFLSDPIRS
ncbi:hypothetical protein [Bradyrhizobium sp. 170]|uniref:hypothetical protein n=1 Tax=Bradyrhizobium sp. 170 TaxID=2782641 RepID=UPI003211DDDB